jgi:hypothetical protein
MAAPDIAQAVNDGRTAVSSVARPRRRYAVKDAIGQVLLETRFLAAERNRPERLGEPDLLRSGPGQGRRTSAYARG